MQKRMKLRKRASEKGAVQVEFALVALTLLLAVFAIIEMERMILVYTTLNNSTKAAVRYAIVHGSDRAGSGVTGPSGPSPNDTNVKSVVTDLVKAGSLNPANVTVTVTYTACTPSTQCPTSNSPGSTVNVTATYPYNPFTVLPLNVTLRSFSQGIITF